MNIVITGMLVRCVEERKPCACSLWIHCCSHVPECTRYAVGSYTVAPPTSTPSTTAPTTCRKLTATAAKHVVLRASKKLLNVCCAVFILSTTPWAEIQGPLTHQHEYQAFLIFTARAIHSSTLHTADRSSADHQLPQFMI